MGNSEKKSRPRTGVISGYEDDLREMLVGSVKESYLP